MKVTVLGSSGQVGAYLTEYLRGKGHTVHEFDIVNGRHQDGTVIPNAELHRVIYDTDFVFFLAFDVGGSRYLKKYQHTFKFSSGMFMVLRKTMTKHTSLPTSSVRDLKMVTLK